MDLTTVEKNLKERGFKVSAFATAKEAADYLNAQIDGERVVRRQHDALSDGAF